MKYVRHADIFDSDRVQMQRRERERQTTRLAVDVVNGYRYRCIRDPQYTSRGAIRREYARSVSPEDCRRTRAYLATAGSPIAASANLSMRVQTVNTSHLDRCAKALRAASDGTPIEEPWFDLMQQDMYLKGAQAVLESGRLSNNREATEAATAILVKYLSPSAEYDTPPYHNHVRVALRAAEDAILEPSTQPNDMIREGDA